MANAGRPTPSTTASSSAALPPAYGAHIGVKPPKVALPDTFSGERSKLKAFLVQLELYMRFNQATLRNEADKILFASTYLRGGAFEWFEPFVTDYVENDEDDREADTVAIFDSWEAFKERIKMVYGDVDETRTAERQLHRLRQTSSANKYVAEFQQTASRLMWDDAALTSQFYQGLKDNVKDDIVRGERPDTLQEMIATAVKIDNRLYERQLEKGEHRHPIPFRPKPKPNQTRTRQYPHNYYGPRPMELDATKGKAVPDKAKRDKSKDKCNKCGKTGHWARECRSGPRHLNATNGSPEQDKGKSTQWVKIRKTVSASDSQHPDHGMMSWTACTEDSCWTHKSEKDGAGWYPRATRGSRDPKN